MISDSTDTISSGTSVVGYDDYFPYGSIMPIRSHVSSEFDRYKFTGKYRDTETGYDYFGARYYDSWLGRFLSVDPMSKKYPRFSPYNYTLDNPLRLVDPHGESFADPYKGPLPCCKTYPRSFPEWGNNFTPFLTSKIKTATKTTIENVAKYADQASKASDKTEATGIGMAVVGEWASFVAPEAGLPEAGTGLALAGFSEGVGNGADFVSAAAKWMDVGFGGSKAAAVNQSYKVAVDLTTGSLLGRLLPESVRSEMNSVLISTFKDVFQMNAKQIIDQQLGVQ
ncbi:MAG TPA: RHS repeat-associated core domain-containing protein [Balneolales bacterium]|nr:RHS repeat-associated core domain-containing protein [Balneolales bacterium]